MSTGTAERPKSKTKTIPLALIDENHVALRSVDRKSEKYLGLVDSIRRDGIINPPSVREIRGDNNEIRYSIIDGLHRISAAQDAGLEEIPANVMSMSDGRVLIAQIIGNVHKVETKPIEYARQLQKILAQNPMMTMADMANQLSKTPQWVGKMLKLVNLPENIAPLVNDGQIVLSNAHALVELHSVAPEEVTNFLDRAQTMSPSEFVPTIQSRVKQVKEDLRKGRDPSRKDEFTPVVLAQKPAVLKEEYERHPFREQVLAAVGATNAQEGWDAAIAWAVNMDPVSIASNEKKFKERKQAEAEERERRKKERQQAENKNAAVNTVNAAG